jgi:gluconate kinase
LYGEIELIAARKEQFMRAGLLDSQLATLEERAPVGWDGARHKRHQDASRASGDCRK